MYVCIGRQTSIRKKERTEQGRVYIYMVEVSKGLSFFANRKSVGRNVEG
jgi:hypothetical protein